MVLARGNPSILARCRLPQRALAGAAAIALLGPLACGGRAESDPPPLGAEEDASTGDAAEGVTAMSADSAVGYPDGGARQADSAGPSTVVSQFPLGAYDCSYSFDFAQDIPPMDIGIALGNGTLTLALSGSVLTATFTGISYIDVPVASGSLEFLLSTGTTANSAAPGQTLDVTCLPDGQFSPPSDTLNVTSGSLTLDSTTVALGFVGAFAGGGAGGDMCPGQPLLASLVCTKP
jgi:hypothetical protein